MQKSKGKEKGNLSSFIWLIEHSLIIYRILSCSNMKNMVEVGIFFLPVIVGKSRENADKGHLN